MRLHAGRLRWTMSECNVTTGLLNMARLSWRCARAAAHGDHHHTVFTHRQTFGHGGVVWVSFFFFVTIILGFSASNITIQQARMVDSNLFFYASLHLPCLWGYFGWNCHLAENSMGPKEKETMKINAIRQLHSGLAIWRHTMLLLPTIAWGEESLYRAKLPYLSRRKLMLRHLTFLKGVATAGAAVADRR